jgi:hypothetical protein
MRTTKLSCVAIATVMAISLYFVLSWGLDALRLLTSPTYGLDDVWRAQVVFAMGHVFGLMPLGLIKLAAFLATLKLAVAVICAVHIIDRLRNFIGGTANPEVLEAGLILIVAISIVSVGPAVWSHNGDLVREYVLQLALAGIAVALCMVERVSARDETMALATPQPAALLAPWR